ncbi:MAG: hypothetical protein ACYC6I_09055, partial [Bacillota bacterium]
VYDGLGSVRQLADAQGAVFDRYTYSPYGLPAANGRLNPSHKLNDGNTFGLAVRTMTRCSGRSTSGRDTIRRGWGASPLPTRS